MEGALARCVGDVERFLAEHWTQGPLHRPGADAAAFGDLLSLEDVDYFISTFPRLPAFRLVKQGKALAETSYTKSAWLGGKLVSGVGDATRIYEEFRNGATIALHGLHRYWPPVMRFCRRLELELTHPVQANAYITPRSSRGLGVHHDTHEVFVLQLNGRKAWSVYEPVVELPLPSQAWSSSWWRHEEPILTAELEPGDCLYIPRGFPHSATSREEVTAHLTVGVITFTWNDVVGDILNGLVDETEFRRPLPIGFARDEDGLSADVAAHVEMLQQWLAKVDSRTVAKALARRFLAQRPAILTGHLGQLMALERLADTSVVRRREGSICHITRKGDRVSVLLGDRELTMPGAVEPAMRWIDEAGEFGVRDLAGHLDEQSRLVLVHRLVREGLLEILTA